MTKHLGEQTAHAPAATALTIVPGGDESARAGTARNAAGMAAGPAEAGFLVQLIACKAGLEPYRRHRRAEPGLASDRYRASAERRVTSEPPARVFRSA